MTSAHDAREMLVRAIVRGHGGQTMRWRTVIGELRVYPLATHPHCNWRVDPSGTTREVEIVKRAVDLLSAQHPILA